MNELVPPGARGWKLDRAFSGAGDRLGYTVGQARVSLNFKNLTDAEYETRGFGSASVIPADPFAVYGRIAYSFGKR